MNYNQEVWARCMCALWNMSDVELHDAAGRNVIPNRYVYSDELHKAYYRHTRFQFTANEDTKVVLLEHRVKQLTI